MASKDMEKAVEVTTLEPPHEKIAPTQESNGAAVAPKDEAPESGPRKTPFPSPVESTSTSEPAPLTTDQETSYNSLLNAVSGWTYIPASASPGQGSPNLTDAEHMWLTRDCLLRYLRASKWSVQTAKDRLASTLQWRRTYGLTTLPPDEQPKITADHISPENETGKQWVQGYDIEGRPCLYLNPSRQNTQRSERQIEHLVFMLERVIDLTPAGQETVALLINFAETRNGQGASVGQGRQVLSILQNHYPERLGRALLCSLPWHIWAFMKCITPFIDPLTRKKIVYDSPLENHVPPAQLCKSHGGTLDFEYEHGVYWPALNDLADERRRDMLERWERGGKMLGEYELYLKGGTSRSLRDDLKDNPNEQGKGRPLGGTPSRTPQKERSVVLLSGKDDDGGEVAEGMERAKPNGKDGETVSQAETAVPDPPAVTNGDGEANVAK